MCACGDSTADVVAHAVIPDAATVQVLEEACHVLPNANTEASSSPAQYMRLLNISTTRGPARLERVKVDLASVDDLWHNASQLLRG